MEHLKHNSWTTLTADIAYWETSFAVADATKLPDRTPFRVFVDTEIMRVTSVSGNMLTTVYRGEEGTTPAAHTSGTRIINAVTAETLMRMAVGGLSRRVDSDWMTKLCYTFNESAPPYANTGSYGALNLSPTPSGQVVSRRGIHRLAAANNAYSVDGCLSSTPSFVQLELSLNMTVSCWVMVHGIRSVGGDYAPIVGRTYNLSGGSWAYCLRINGWSANDMQFGISGIVTLESVGAVELIVPAQGTAGIPLNRWTHLALVRNNPQDTTSLYNNGEIVASSSGSGDHYIDVNNRGYVVVAGDPFSANDYLFGRVDDFRVDGLARSTDYLERMYLYGVNEYH